jgi:hypothetical protein
MTRRQCGAITTPPSPPPSCDVALFALWIRNKDLLSCCGCGPDLNISVQEICRKGIHWIPDLRPSRQGKLRYLAFGASCFVA